MIDLVELLAVRNVEASREPPPFDARGWPLAVRPADFRPLPWPFAAFASISNDCDSPIFTFAEIDDAMGYMREALGLPIGDSYFPDLVCSGIVHNQPTTKPEDIPAMVSEPGNEAFVARAGEYVRKAHLGWFDTVHGFLSANTIKLPFTDSEAAGASGPHPKHRQRLRTLAVQMESYEQVERFGFHTPTGWEELRPPRYLLLLYCAPVRGSAVHIHVYVGDELKQAFRSTAKAEGTPLNAPNWYVIELWRCVGMSRADLHNVEVEIGVFGPPGAYVDIHDLIQTSHIMAEIERFSRILKRYNMTSSVFTSHGIGLVFAPPYAADNIAADSRRLADLPQNPHYSVNLVKNHGIRFINTYSKTSVAAVFPVVGLAYVNRLNDGSLVYDFHRYVYHRKTPEGANDASFWTRSGRSLKPSMSDTLGTQINGLLQEVEAKRFSGGLIYTHIYAANKAVEGEDAALFDRPFNLETREALAALSERYLNPRGRLPPDRRVMVAPQPTLLRLSVMQQQIAGHAYLDDVQDEVHVEPWFDPVLGETTPSAATGFRELRALTFYVKDSHSARLYVDGMPYHDLIRNPPDETGRPSITVADASAPAVLLGRVPLSQTRAAVAVDGAALKEPDSAGGAPSGAHVLKLTAARGALIVKPALASARNYQALRLVFAKSNATMCIGLRLRFRSGLELALGESGLAIAGAHFELDAWRNTEPRVVVVPFYMWLERASRIAGGLAPGLDGILSWEVVVAGQEGQTVAVDSLQLLRDCDRPEQGEGFVVGGKCAADIGVVAVRMQDAGRIFEARVAQNDLFIFSRKVTRGSIVEVFGLDKAGGEVPPANGRFVEILTDKTDIDFVSPTGSAG